MATAAQLKVQRQAVDQDSSFSSPGNPSLREVSLRNSSPQDFPGNSLSPIRNFPAQNFPVQLAPGGVPVTAFYGAAQGVPPPWPGNPNQEVQNSEGPVNTEIKIATRLQASTAQAPDPAVLQAAASAVHQAQANTAEVALAADAAVRETQNAAVMEMAKTKAQATQVVAEAQNAVNMVTQQAEMQQIQKEAEMQQREHLAEMRTRAEVYQARSQAEAEINLHKLESEKLKEEVKILKRTMEQQEQRFREELSRQKEALDQEFIQQQLKMQEQFERLRMDSTDQREARDAGQARSSGYDRETE